MRDVKLQRRHFEFIANTIKFADVDTDAKVKLAREFATQLKATNPQFNRDRFLEAAGAL